MKRIFALLLVSTLACGGSSSSAPTGPKAHEHSPEGNQAKAQKHKHGHAPLGHRFEDAQEWAKRFDAPSRDAWQKPTEVVERMELTAGMAVADIGAGTGYFLPYLSSSVGPRGTVIGLDIEPDMVRYMKERAVREGLENVTARQVAVDTPELSRGSVDAILVVDTWHHIPDRVAYARDMAGALRAGGAIFIVDFTMETEKGPHKDHRLSPGSIALELEAAGLDAKVIAEDLPDQFIVRGRLP